MADGYIENKGAVNIFLAELKRILEDKDARLNILPREEKEVQYTTRYCLRELGYTEEDVRGELQSLKIKDYVETCDDERNKKSNRYYIFKKVIINREIYIKVKIESYDNKIVLCMSFHFAEYPLKTAY